MEAGGLGGPPAAPPPEPAAGPGLPAAAVGPPPPSLLRPPVGGPPASVPRRAAPVARPSLVTGLAGCGGTYSGTALSRARCGKRSGRLWGLGSVRSTLPSSATTSGSLIPRRVGRGSSGGRGGAGTWPPAYVQCVGHPHHSLTCPSCLQCCGGGGGLLGSPRLVRVPRDCPAGLALRASRPSVSVLCFGPCRDARAPGRGLGPRVARAVMGLRPLFPAPAGCPGGAACAWRVPLTCYLHLSRRP
jgi:hypothetical protein